MSIQQADTTQQEPTLVGMKTALNAVFPDPSSRPSFRAWNDWKAKGYFPSVKIGRRVFLDPVAVRKALEARFTINTNK